MVLIYYLEKGKGIISNVHFIVLCELPGNYYNLVIDRWVLSLPRQMAVHLKSGIQISCHFIVMEKLTSTGPLIGDVTVVWGFDNYRPYF